MNIYDLIYIEHFKGVQSAVDKLFDLIDDSFKQGEFDKVDDFLLKIPIEIISLQMIISLLSITYLAKEKLNNRTKFFEEAKIKISKTESKERCKRLLDGLT